MIILKKSPHEHVNNKEANGRNRREAECLGPAKTS